MKFVSWNVNGLRACLKKGFAQSVLALDADFICLQETKMEQGQAVVDLPGYHQFWNSADKKGYSGTAIFVREQPLAAAYGMDLDRHDHEGRLITLEYPEFFLVDCYTPNAQNELARIGYRMEWEDDLLDYLKSLDKTKPVIYCGDLNVAHEEIDLKNPKTNRGNAGFSDQERGAMTRLLSSGFTDTFRLLYPGREGAVLLVELPLPRPGEEHGMAHRLLHRVDRLGERVAEAAIHPDIQGSDHCPVSLILK